jgi:hypothetical protein
VRCETLTAVKMSMLVFWVLTQRGLVGRSNVSEENTASIFRAEVDFSAEDGGSMFLRNFGITVQVHMALQPRRTNTDSVYCGRCHDSCADCSEEAQNL